MTSHKIYVSKIYAKTQHAIKFLKTTYLHVLKVFFLIVGEIFSFFNDIISWISFFKSKMTFLDQIHFKSRKCFFCIEHFVVACYVLNNKWVVVIQCINRNLNQVASSLDSKVNILLKMLVTFVINEK